MSINSDVMGIVKGGVNNLLNGMIPQMSLGTFKFELNSAVYQELQRNRAWRWPAQERVGLNEKLQYLGDGTDEITLQGVIYPDYKGGQNQIEAMAALARKGKPQILIDGYGKVYGRFVITGIEEKHSIYGGGGRSRKQDFTLKLRYFDGGGLIITKNPVKKLLGDLGL